MKKYSFILNNIRTLLVGLTPKDIQSNKKLEECLCKEILSQESFLVVGTSNVDFAGVIRRGWSSRIHEKRIGGEGKILKVSSGKEGLKGPCTQGLVD